MLINCPRCGFSQPQDQYCAQCGVDMQAYRPKTPPWHLRFFGNAGVQITLLVIAAVFVGQRIIRSKEPQTWVQKMTHFQGMSRTESRTAGAGNDRDAKESLSADAQGLSDTQEISSSSQAEPLADLRNRQLRLSRGGPSAPVTAGAAGTAATVPAATEGISTAPAQPEPGTVTFKLNYAEVSYEMLQKWIADSSAAGLYQSLPEYSAGILTGFHTRGDSPKQILKTTDIKLAPGGANSNISGTMNDDGSQLIGLITALEYRSAESDSVNGNISVTRNNGQTSESYPAEFHLPRGAVFFIVGALKRDNFATDRDRLNMPPFQVLKSDDFMTRKTEFVIILEPEYK